MKMLSSAVIPAIIILMAYSGLCGAQETARPGPPGFGRKNPQREAQFKEWIWNNLKNYLWLDEATAARLKPIFQEYGATRGKLMHERIRLIRLIDSNVDNPAVSIKEMREYSKKFAAVNKSLTTESDKFFRKAKSILSERQYIKLLISEDRAKEDIFRRMGKHSDREKPLPPEPPDK